MNICQYTLAYDHYDSASHALGIPGLPVHSWVTFFAETNATTPDSGWSLIDPLHNYVSLAQMTACPSVRWYNGWYYVATTTQGSTCPPAGWANESNALCVILFRSKTLKSGTCCGVREMNDIGFLFWLTNPVMLFFLQALTCQNHLVCCLRLYHYVGRMAFVASYSISNFFAFSKQRFFSAPLCDSLVN